MVTTYFYFDNSAFPTGPLSLEDIKEHLDQGKLASHIPVARTGAWIWHSWGSYNQGSSWPEPKRIPQRPDGDFSSGRVTILSDRIRVRSLFGTRELLWTDLAGYRTPPWGLRRLILTSKTQGERPITLGSEFLGDHPVGQWLRHFWPDLDKAELARSNAFAEAEASMAEGQAKRRLTLRAASNAIGIQNIVLLLLSLWGFFWPVPYRLVIPLLALAPCIALALRWGLPRYFALSRTAYERQAVGWAFPFPWIALLLRAFYDIHFLPPFWGIALTLGGIALVVGLMVGMFFRSAMTGLIVGFLAGVVSFGPLAEANVLLDRSTHRLTAPVIAVEATGGKGPNFWITLGAWGDRPPGDRFHVPIRTFLHVRTGDEIPVVRGNGALGVSWAVVGSR